MYKISALLFLIFYSLSPLNAQALKPGFNKAEYLELLKVNAKCTYLVPFKSIPNPEKFRLCYRSPIVALDNAWELWTSGENVAAISIRGTTEKTESWLANFYAAMVPAKGQLILGEKDTFRYELADNPKAAVHAGWLVATAFLSKTILPQIDSCYRAGIKNYYIIGHSQGGAISYLLTAYLYHLQLLGKLPKDIRFKTYCSAGPKPGNLFFAYDYEASTQEGWAYNVVNSDDWVPEAPVSVQTFSDFPEVNPFRYVRTAIKAQKFPKNIVFRYLYNRLDKPTRRAQRNFEKYLGKVMGRYVVKALKGFETPAYYPSDNFVRTGNYVVLKGDADYYKHFPLDKKKIFQHHMFDAYYYLAERL
ncbi:MAG: lipase family protein [Chitinophagaceae bacterium]